MEGMKRLLDVHGSNIVGEENDLVGMQLVLVFSKEIGGLDEAALEQADDEGACSRERVNDVNVFVAEAGSKFLLEHVTDAVDDEIYHLHWGVDDAESLRNFWESRAEELVV